MAPSTTERYHKLRRCQSVAAIHYGLEPSTKTPTKAYTMKKYSSQMNLNDISEKRAVATARTKDLSSKYRYQRDWLTHDDFWWERRNYLSPLHWPFVQSANRRYNYIDPPYALWGHYPGLWAYPRWAPYLSEQSHLNGLYWHRYRDPKIDRPWHQPWRAEVSEVPRALKMYREKLIDFYDLDRNWLKPSSYQRREFDKRHGFSY